MTVCPLLGSTLGIGVGEEGTSDVAMPYRKGGTLKGMGVFVGFVGCNSVPGISFEGPRYQLSCKSKITSRKVCAGVSRTYSQCCQGEGRAGFKVVVD